MKKTFTIIAIIAVILVIIVALVPGTGKKAASSGGVKDVQIISTSETMEYSVRTVHVILQNNSDKLLKFVTLKVTYTDASGKVVGTGNGGGQNIPAHEKRTVDCNAVDIMNPDKYEVQTDLVVFE